MFKGKRPLIRFLLISFIVVVSLFVLLFTALAVYSSTSYEPLSAMEEQINTLDTQELTYIENRKVIQYTVTNPIKNIIIIPGGLVEPESYKYLAISLAKENYNITIVKPLFNLAILNANQAEEYLDSSLDNILIGHSLGGTVASIVASNNPEVNAVVLLGSYPLRDISNIDSLVITGENDEVLDQEAFTDSLELLSTNSIFYEISGGNHAQFGWYGPQKGDGQASITTLEQQDLVIEKILDFIK